MAQTLKEISKQLIKFEKERIFWLRLSAFVILMIFGIVWKWDIIQLNHIQWVFVTLGLTVSVVWWYWTMRVIRLTLGQRSAEIEILSDIVSDIKDIKNKMSDLPK